MGKIEDIMECVIRELEELRDELKREIKRLELKSNLADSRRDLLHLQHQIEGIEIAISRITKRIKKREELF